MNKTKTKSTYPPYAISETTGGHHSLSIETPLVAISGHNIDTPEVKTIKGQKTLPTYNGFLRILPTKNEEYIQYFLNGLKELIETHQKTNAMFEYTGMTLPINVINNPEYPQHNEQLGLWAKTPEKYSLIIKDVDGNNIPQGEREAIIPSGTVGKALIQFLTYTMNDKYGVAVRLNAFQKVSEPPAREYTFKTITAEELEGTENAKGLGENYLAAVDSIMQLESVLPKEDAPKQIEEAVEEFPNPVTKPKKTPAKEESVMANMFGQSKG